MSHLRAVTALKNIINNNKSMNAMTHKKLLHNLRIIRILLLVFSGISLTACEKSLNLKLTREAPISLETFEQTEGLKLPYQLYMPNSMSGWSIGDSTRFTFDTERKVYVLDNILLDVPLVDDLGYRFKLCSESWRYQFGFGTYITDDESTIGIPETGAVVRVERFAQPSTDIRIEPPMSDSNTNERRLLRIEFKLTHWEPHPQGLLRVNIYKQPL